MGEKERDPQILESNFFLLVSSLSTTTKKPQPTPLNNHQPPTPLPTGILLFIYPLRSSQNPKCHTITETICSWQNHARGKSVICYGGQSGAAPYLSILGIKTKTYSYISVFKEVKIPKLSLHITFFISPYPGHLTKWIDTGQHVIVLKLIDTEQIHPSLSPLPCFTSSSSKTLTFSLPFFLEQLP